MKLGKKFMLSLSAVLIAVICFSLYINANVISRCYLYLEKKDLNRICSELSETLETLEGSDSPLTFMPPRESDAAIFSELEEENDVTLIRVPDTKDNDLLNDRLRDAFTERGLGFRKLWLWDQDQRQMDNGERRIRLYRQEGLHYSLLVEYLKEEPYFYAAVKIIPEAEHTIALLNRITAIIFASAVLLLVALISLLVRRITKPLQAIKATARSIAELDFCTVHVNTHDELGELADSINRMSQKLKTAHQDLEQKNRQMEELLANVSHDLKTPISLIKAYASGINDGLDDGTFSDTILSQTDRMEELVGRLLALAKLKQTAAQTGTVEPISLTEVLNRMTRDYSAHAAENHLTFLCLWENGADFHFGSTSNTGSASGSGAASTASSASDSGSVPATGPAATISPPLLHSQFTLEAESESLDTILSNLLSNAVSYAAPGTIELSLSRQEDRICLRIKNNLSENASATLDPKRIWEPFYVGESSRNRSLSGTGLGLSIVRAAAEHCGYQIQCKIESTSIEFQILF